MTSDTSESESVQNFFKLQAARATTIDDAFEVVGFGTFNWIIIIITGLALGSVFIETICINLILPIAQCDLNLSSTDKSWLSSICLIGILCSSHFWGFIADTRGRKKVIALPLFFTAIFSVLSSFATSFRYLLILRFLAGVCIAGPSAICYAFIGEFHSKKLRAISLMYTSVMFGITSFWYPFTGSLIMSHESNYELFGVSLKPWRLYFIISTIPTLISAVCFQIFIPESPKFTFTQGDEKKTLKILKLAYMRNTGKSDFPIKTLLSDEEFGTGKIHPRAPLKFMWSQTRPLFQSSHIMDTFRACFIQFSISATFSGFWVFYPEIVNGIALWKTDEYGGNLPADICRIFNETRKMTTRHDENCLLRLEPSTFVNVTILNGIYSVGWLVLAFVINKIGHLIALNSILFICALSSILLIVVEDAQAASFLLLVLLSCGIAITIVNSSTAELFPTNIRAMAMSVSLMFGRFGGVCGAHLVGHLIDENCQLIFSMPIILLSLSAFLALSMPQLIGN